ncbi:ABC transporter ced-7 [Aphelenchoides fujianensis]|nr:ABC transporter ced-7 [Aphelenchoides fujianensis]
MSTAKQMVALGVKDLQVAKRSKCRCCCELAFPLFFFPFLLIMMIFSLKNSANVDYASSAVELKIDHQRPPRLFFDLPKAEDFDKLKGIADANPTHYPPLKTKDDPAAKTNDPNDPNYHGVFVHFREFDLQKPKFRYTLRYNNPNVVEEQPFKETGWRGGTPFSTTYFVPDKGDDGPTPMINHAFLDAQHMVDALLLEVAGGQKLLDVKVAYMPTKSYRWSIMNAALPYLSILVVFCSLIPQALVAKDVITELESEVKASRVYLMILGMNRVAFYFSHFINGCIKMSLIMLILMLPIAASLQVSAGIVTLLLSEFFVIFAVAHALLWSTLLHKPGACLTAIIVMNLVLCVIAFVSTADTTNLVMMCVSSLNPVFALWTGFQDLRFYDQQKMFPWPGNRFGYQFNYVFALLFIILDTILVVLLTMLLDFVIPSAGQPGLNLAMFRKRKKALSVEEQAAAGSDFQSIRRAAADADLAVNALKKRWNMTGDYAVQGVSFAAYRGEITCLLGHNGAGKSTVFSCLTGYTKPTSGMILIGGKNVLTDLTEIRKSLGYCPQFNPLYDRLTCIEHLRLATRLRGVPCEQTELTAILDAVGLAEKRNVESSKLSGGMKRKLCVAMALVGKSRVVLLDEPTAGMDPTARKQIGEILEKFKEDRTIILTTHYMDEADRLSDRIVIVVKGRVVCNGSSEFLKKRFGTGFLLTISLAHGQADVPPKAEKILALTRQHVPEAKFSGSPAAQFTINLPYESKTKFAQLFVELETQSAELDIDSFGLSVNTLEQVFIKVGEKAEGESNDELRARIVENANAVRQGDHDHSPSIFKQWWALCIRNFIYWLRHPVRTLIPLLIILFCFVFLFVKSKTGKTAETKDGDFFYGLNELPRSEVFVKNVDGIGDVFSPLEQCTIVNGKVPTADNNLDVPPPSLGFAKGGQVALMANRFLTNGLFIAANAYANSLFQTKAPDTIEMGVRVNMTEVGGSSANMFNGIVIPFGLAFGLAMLLSEIVTERVTKFKHQIRLTGCRAPTYWIAQLTTDFAYFFILAAIVFAGVMIVFKPSFGCTAGFVRFIFCCELIPAFASVLPVWLLYFYAASMASYVLSFRFESATKATVFVLAFHTIIPMFTYGAFAVTSQIAIGLIVKGPESAQKAKTVLDVLTVILGTIFPAIPLLQAQSVSSQLCGGSTRTFADNYRILEDLEPPQRNVIDTAAAGPLIILVISALLYTSFLVLTELGLVGKLRAKREASRASASIKEDEAEDPDVTAERQAIDSMTDSDLALACRGLVKCYGKKVAVRNLTFGIRPSECFGLLGVNGAGKTTTFDILSNISRPTAGTTTIGGQPTETTPAIGYCPQFDALSEFLTARDTLRLFGRLNGFPDVSERMRMILECVMMEEHADKLVKSCSGGQKRRVSIAVALMSGADCLLLDEPTAGVDPATRRQIWDLLTAVRLQGKSILLTTHSMEECEALCTRIGFLRDGRLRGIGTSQHLKTRYGNSYNLTLILNRVPKEVAATIDDAVQKHYGVPPTPDSLQLANLSWTIPRRSDQTWSAMYADVEKLAAEVNTAHGDPIRDFYLIQDSLEQVFTRLATNEKEAAGAKKKQKAKNAVDSPAQQPDPMVDSGAPQSVVASHPVSADSQKPHTGTTAGTPADNQN